MIVVSADIIDVIDAARLESLAQQLAGGAVVCYPGGRPNTAGGIPLAGPVARIPFAPGVGTVVSKALQITAPIEGQVIQSAAITWARIETGAGAWVADCDAADLQLDRTDVIVGGFVRLLETAFS